MKLIDADKVVDELANALPYIIETNTELAYADGLETCYRIVQTIQTVDAIPIEWLEEKYKDLEYSYAFGATDELSSRMDGIRYIINLWRQENA